MNDMEKTNAAEESIMIAHTFLKDFVAKHDMAARGGIHDFIEVSIFKLVHTAIKNIDEYLKIGHKEVIASEIMHIIADSYQKSLDGIKRNLESMKEVRFK